MEKKQFQAESQRLLEMMVNSIYSQKEIFLREIISNASDAIDKIYYQALTDDQMTFNQDDYYIRIEPDQENRTLTIKDTGIGMTREELETNLGTIAKSGSLDFKNQVEMEDGQEIIGQFGVGFYSSFMVADKVTVYTRALHHEEGYKWESNGQDGYTIEPIDREEVGTEIIIQLKENTEDENYDEFLEEQRLTSIIKKYSDFIRYPIKMDVTEQKPKEDDEETFEEVTEEQTLNNMVPIWRKNKQELTDEDYESFYQEKRFGFDQPLSHLHISVDGMVRFQSILYIPEQLPFNYYSQDFEKGLELYSNGVLIMEKCADLLPDHFSFVKGIVDSEDLSLNISREILQQDKQVRLISKNIEKKVKNHLLSLLKNDREKYEKFFDAFGRQLKYGVYAEFGANKEKLQDLLLFYSSSEKKLVSLSEYVERMPEDQEYIYYATGESHDRIENLPQTELVKDKGYEILYFTDEVDEFAIKMLMQYDDKEFKSVASGDLDLEDEETKQEAEKQKEEHKDLLTEMKEILGNKVKDVKLSTRLKSHPVCLSAEGEVSIEMEKVLKQMPDNQNIEANKVLEINNKHDIFQALVDAHENDKEKVQLYTNILYNQALLIEGLPVDDPVALTNDMCKVMA
ncbi:heat shock protein 90 [Gracilibacillus halophilus YIM-C55.5]|uniref:Chaperone protein HtpG n=1 Tax=Gracilibacillus halophilus YIM-C55.5 TaxID=1308866 RepID=N4WVR1_9BACI|nr:molecular chaperone HtpG [Gracilibacillus halophilus]ENH97171.1 heat shock protein 90 [Gracilibacillus halophilus YIM-C55.5]